MGKQHNIHSGSSPQRPSTSGCDQEPPETLIKFVYKDDSPWDSDLDESDTSTPDLKRGRHTGQSGNETGNSTSTKKSKLRTHWKPDMCKQAKEEITNLEAVHLIQREGLDFSLPTWVKSRPVKASVLILADAQLKYWPSNDKVCDVQCHPKWPIRRWNQALHMGIIKIDCLKVVLYLEATRHWQDVLPIKNSLHALCKTIRSLSSNPTIFISNLLPRVEPSPVQYPISQTNFLIQHATRSISRAMHGASTNCPCTNILFPVRKRRF